LAAETLIALRVLPSIGQSAIVCGIAMVIDIVIVVAVSVSGGGAGPAVKASSLTTHEPLVGRVGVRSH
jgi:hypothetical protein